MTKEEIEEAHSLIVQVRDDWDEGFISENEDECKDPADMRDQTKTRLSRLEAILEAAVWKGRGT